MSTRGDRVFNLFVLLQYSTLSITFERQCGQ